MSKKHWSEWQPLPRTRQLLNYFQMPWVVADDIRDYGSSVGDAIWTGRYLVLEADMPQPWVHHEIGHYIACQKTDPRRRFESNYGLDRLTGEQPPKFDEDLEESDAANLGLWLQIACGHPFLSTAGTLNTFSYISEEDIERCGGEEEALREHVDKTAKEYLPHATKRLEDTPPKWLIPHLRRVDAPYLTSRIAKGDRRDQRERL